MMIYSIDQQQQQQSNLHRNKSNEQQTISRNNSKNKCLILVFSLAVVIIVMCSILMVALMTRFIIFNNDSLTTLTDYIINTNINANNNNVNNKTERNSFNNWIKDNFRQKFLGFNIYDKKNYNNYYNSQNDFYYPGILDALSKIDLYNMNIIKYKRLWHTKR